MGRRTSSVIVASAFVLAASACGDGAGSAPVCAAPARCEGPPPVELGDLGRFTRVAALSDGRLAIATWDATRKNMVVLFERPDGSERDAHVVDGWRTVVEGGGARLVDVDAGRWASLAVGAGDVVHVAWFDADEGELHYARGTPALGFGPVEVVDGDGPAVRGTHASLALDALGEPHVAYRDESTRDLRYARRGADGMWRSVAIDGCAGEPGCPVSGAEDFGEWAALAFVPAVGGGVSPRIAFYDRYRGDLKMAAQSGDGGWVTSTLDGRDPVTSADAGDVGRFVSVAATPTRQLGIAYYDATRGALRYLAPGAAPRVVDDGRYVASGGGARRLAVGQHVRLGYDATGRAHMIYADASTPGLRHAMVVGETAPQVSPLDLPAGGWVDFVAASDGRLVGAYGAFLEGAAPRTRLEIFEVAP